MLQRDNIPAKPRRFSLIQHPITSDISLRRRYTSKYKLNAAIAEGEGLSRSCTAGDHPHHANTPGENQLLPTTPIHTQDLL